MLHPSVLWRAACLAVALAAMPGVASADLYVSIQRSPDPRATGVLVFASAVDAAGAPYPVEATFTVERSGAVIGRQNRSASPVQVCCSGLVAQAGDVIRVTSPESFVMTFDGRPAFDASVCGATAAFQGLRTDARTGVDFVGARRPNGDPYSAGTYVGATVETLVGDTFGGSFKHALTPAHVITVDTRRNDGDVTVASSFERLVGTCPAPPPPAAPVTAPLTAPAPPAAVRDTLAPTGRLSLRKLKGGLRALLAGRAVTGVVVDEARTTVTQAVYLDDGARLPASAAKRATLIASGRAISTKAGTVTLHLKPTAAARRLRGKRSAKLALVTTLRDAAGNARSLPLRKLSVGRR